MKNLTVLISCLLLSTSAYTQSKDTLFSLPAVKSYPFPNELNAAPTGSRIAWALNEAGLRNIYVAEGPDFKPRQLTNYNLDDGQELTSVSLSHDGSWVVYVRGGDHGSNWDDHMPINPAFSPTPPKVQIWSAPFKGGEPKLLGDGEEPVISSKGVVAFHKGGQIWTVPVDGSGTATQLFTARGTNADPVWSPDGSKLAFQSARVDHSFIGIYSTPTAPIVWLDPGYTRDISPGR
jgi:Tol biopolymer transport system component